eukprot:TRINITY_DN1298_c1_g1_i1.p1 TRINITY_DN1298_c1_g1~~TRINITY_DN1298_c1_g1_i1.p1  ORF type:complete len:572 (-),score=141.58 TRINITY_DN1298_c1_g1_i1:97-1812(-)
MELPRDFKNALVSGDQSKILEYLASPLYSQLEKQKSFTIQCSAGKVDSVNIFLKSNKIDVNFSDPSFQNGVTALHGSVYSKNPKIVKILLENGADINAKIQKGDHANFSALELSKKLPNCKEVESLLLEHLKKEGADFKTKTTPEKPKIEHVQNSNQQQQQQKQQQQQQELHNLQLEKALKELTKKNEELAQQLVEARDQMTRSQTTLKVTEEEARKNFERVYEENRVLKQQLSKINQQQTTPSPQPKGPTNEEKQKEWIDLIQEFKIKPPDLFFLNLVVLSQNPSLPWRVPYKLSNLLNWERHEHYRLAELPRDEPEYQQISELFYSGGIKNSKTRSLQLEKIDIIDNQAVEHRFVSQLYNLERQRMKEAFNQTNFRPSQTKVLNERLKPRFAPTGLRRSNALLAWHGCSHNVLPDIMSDGMKDLRKVDGGFFASGVYLTFQSEYAAFYSSKCSELDIRTDPADTTSLFVMVLCWVSVSHSYVITREKPDYSDPDNPDDICMFHFCFPDGVTRSDKKVKSTFDSHFIPISQDKYYQASPIGDVPDYDELVVDRVDQVLPRYAVYFRLKKP